MCFFGTFAFFSLPAAGLFSCSRLRGTQGARRNTTAQVWALADVRGTCSGGPKSQVPRGRLSEHVGPSRPLQPTYRLKKCPTTHSCDIWDLKCHQCCQTLLCDEKVFPRHQHARHATTFSTIRQVSMASEEYGLFSRI